MKKKALMFVSVAVLALMLVPAINFIHWGTAQKKEEKQQTRLRKAKEIEEKRAAKLEEKMAKKTAEQVNKDLNKQLREPLKKDSPILIQKEVVVVAENAAEAEVAVLRHGRLGRELRLPARLR